MHVQNRNSVAYRLALVADGSADASVSLTAKRDWDLAAADIILHEAGGLSDRRTAAQPLIYNRPVTKQASLVAANPALACTRSFRCSAAATIRELSARVPIGLE